MANQVTIPDMKKTFEFIGDSLVTLAAGAAMNKFVTPISTEAGISAVNLLIVVGTGIFAWNALRRHTFFS